MEVQTVLSEGPSGGSGDADPGELRALELNGLSHRSLGYHGSMSFRRSPAFVFVLIGIALPAAVLAQAPAPAQSSAPTSSSSAKHVKKPAAPNASDIEAGAVINGVYRNKAL